MYTDGCSNLHGSDGELGIWPGTLEFGQELLVVLLALSLIITVTDVDAVLLRVIAILLYILNRLIDDSLLGIFSGSGNSEWKNLTIF